MTSVQPTRRDPSSRRFNPWRNALATSLLLLVPALAFTPVAQAEEHEGLTLHQIDHHGIGNRVQRGPSLLASLDYSNITGFLGQAFPNGGAVNQGTNGITRLVADDLTPTGVNAGQDVLEVTFSVANLNTVPVTCRARIRFWNDNGGVPGSYYSAPAAVGFTFNPFTFQPGVTLLTGTIGPGLFDMPGVIFWAGLTFDNNNGTTGATLAQLDLMGQGLFDPPDVGSSDDVAFQTTAAGSFFGTANPVGATFDFGGNPIANFGWEFLVDTPVPTARSTWGRVKSLYR